MTDIEKRLRVLVSEGQLSDICTRLAEKIDRDYAASKKLVLLGILKGSMVFLSDLCRRMKTVHEVEFMRVMSYGTGVRQSSGNVKIMLDLMRDDVSECDILIVEDIVDSGRTLTFLTEYLKEKGAKSVNACALLDKPSRREVEFVPRYTGIEIPDVFVLGYGLDYDEKYRNLPYVAVVESDAQEA